MVHADPADMAIFFDTELITVPFSTKSSPSELGDQDQQYKAILRLCKKFNIAYSESTEVKSLVDSIVKENESFIEFSLKAKNIRKFILPLR